MVAELTALRDQIDEVDKALLDLLARRMSLVAEVGDLRAGARSLHAGIPAKRGRGAGRFARSD